MGSLEEEKLFQMVHDFIESDTPTSPTSTPTSSQAFSLSEPTCRLLEGILGSSTETESAVFEKALKYVAERGSDERKKSSVKRRLMMRLRMDGYDASLCRSSCVANYEYPGGDYEYIDIVVAEEDGVLTRLIVDIDFRSQFELARPTSAYTQVFNTLPPIFVGKEEKLRKVVSLLCSALQQSLKERGLHIPPWRRSSYMQSKWLTCCHKTSTVPFFPSVSAKDVIQRGRRGGAEDGGDESKAPQGSSGLSSQFSNMSINCC